MVDTNTTLNRTRRINRIEPPQVKGLHTAVSLYSPPPFPLRHPTLHIPITDKSTSLPPESRERKWATVKRDLLIRLLNDTFCQIMLRNRQINLSFGIKKLEINEGCKRQIIDLYCFA